jgi:signal transduction histidine kinase
MINKNRFFQIFLWNFGIFYILIFSNIMMFLMNDFNQLQLIVLMINLVILTSLLRWNIAFLMMIIGAVLAIYCYNNFINISSMSNLNFNIIYLLSLFAFILIIFVRPKNERYELSEIKNKHLDERLLTRDCEIEKLLDLKYEFLRNINHEFHAPMTGILTLSDTLWTKYHQLNEKQIYTSIEVITRSARRLNSLLNNILDFSRLTSLSYDLTKINLNFSNLLLERIEICKKLYIENRSVDFFLDIKKNIMVSCDKYYIEQTLDNLIINAITYSAEHGYVEITSYKDEQYVWFRIKDNGVGVANDELMDIFGVFVVGSKTKTPAGGRGIGLALAKKVIELHDGNIWAENNNSENTCFIFNIKIV